MKVDIPPVSGPRIAPVFPLPNVVLFPQTVLPLHVFEPRYREMVRDASRAEGMIAIALLRPGYEADYEGSPPIHELGTVGRIEQLRPLADGRFLLNVVGLQRVRLGETDSDKSYRLARLTPRPERGVDEEDPQVQRAKLDLLASHACLMNELAAGEGARLVMNDRVPFAAAVNGSCANLPIAAEARQGLLALDDLRERQLQAGRLIQQLLEQVLQLKAESGEGQTGGLN